MEDRTDVKRRAYTPVIAVLAVSALAMGGPAFVPRRIGRRGSAAPAGRLGRARERARVRARTSSPGNVNGHAPAATASPSRHALPRCSAARPGSTETSAPRPPATRSRSSGGAVRPAGRWADRPTASRPRTAASRRVWPTNHIGRFAIRAVDRAGADRPGRGVFAGADDHRLPAVDRHLLRPGFLGQRTACGVMLRRRTLGVANRTLKCGTPVAIDYGGTDDRRARDRPRAVRQQRRLGPDAGHGQAAGHPGTATIGAVSLPAVRLIARR